MPGTNVRLVDGQQLELFNQGNTKVSILKTDGNRFVILFGDDPSTATEIFSVTDQNDDIVLSAGTNLLFESD